MDEKLTQQFIGQLEGIERECDAYEMKPPPTLGIYDSQREADQTRLITMMRAAIDRICIPNSAYVLQMNSILARTSAKWHQIPDLIGVIQGLRADLESGHLQSVSELIHGELFGDYLEMAQHLIENDYKDAAAVIAGSTLEAHLRQLCYKNGIEVEQARKDGSHRPKTADKLNSDLAKKSVLTKLDQKNVIAWLDLRNDAAHGHYKKYDKNQVSLMVTSVRDFITRCPA